jgi:hypothetical protein
MTSDEVFHDTIKQGATYSITLTLTDENDQVQDYSGFTPKMQVRKDFLDNDETAVFTLTSGDGIDMTNADDGLVVVTISAARSALLTSPRYLFDLEMKNGDFIERVFQGRFTVSKQVTD